jgi:hypothetical protein
MYFPTAGIPPDHNVVEHDVGRLRTLMPLSSRLDLLEQELHGCKMQQHIAMVPGMVGPQMMPQHHVMSFSPPATSQQSHRPIGVVPAHTEPEALHAKLLRTMQEQAERHERLLQSHEGLIQEQKKLAASKSHDIGSSSSPIGSSNQHHPMPPGPTVYLTSTGFVTESQWVRFIQVVLHRRGVLEVPDLLPHVSRKGLVEKYAAEINKLRVLYINDASYHRPTEMMVKGRSGTGKVGDNGNLGRGPGTWLFWDQALEDMMGVPRKNIKMVQLLEKPWLFNRPGRHANYEASSPDVRYLDKADEAAYYAALKLTQDAYDALKETPPRVGAGQAGLRLPGCPRSGKSCADELAEISSRLNDRYASALDKWCTENIDSADIIVGQGGEVVMLNMAWQCNQAIARRVVDAVRANKCVYAGLSASTMVCAKSMEMTGEIQPGWIEAFAADSRYLNKMCFDVNDLDGDGIKANVLGALPLLESPIAMRPHYSETWEMQVLQKNRLAEKEFEKETGIEIPDDLVRDSKHGCEVACRLLTLVSKHAKDQDQPIFVPIRNGKCIEVHTHWQCNRIYETFRVIQ